MSFIQFACEMSDLQVKSNGEEFPTNSEFLLVRSEVHHQVGSQNRTYHPQR